MSEPPLKFCKKCGNELRQNSKFCTKCSTPVEGSASQIVKNKASQNTLLVGILVAGVIIGTIAGASLSYMHIIGPYEKTGDQINDGIASAKNGDYINATMYYTDALKRDSKLKEAWKLKGDALSGIITYNLKSDAIRCYDKATDIDKNYSDAWKGKGLAYLDLQNSNGALDCYNRSLEINPKDFTAWKFKGDAYTKLLIPNYLEAISCYDKAITISSGYGDAWLAKGNVYFYKVGNYNEAYACYSEAERIYQASSDDGNLRIALYGEYVALKKLPNREKDAEDVLAKFLRI
jgi:tetratricopeptide (TPR) repeat protein